MDEHSQWLLSTMEREEYETWLASLEHEKQAKLNEHLNQLEKEDEHRRDLPKHKIA